MWPLFECSSHGRLIRESEQSLVMNIQEGEKNKQGLWGMELKTNKYSSRGTGTQPRDHGCHFPKWTPTMP